MGGLSGLEKVGESVRGDVQRREERLFGNGAEVRDEGSLNWRFLR